MTATETPRLSRRGRQYRDAVSSPTGPESATFALSGPLFRRCDLEGDGPFKLVAAPWGEIADGTKL